MPDNTNRTPSNYAPSNQIDDLIGVAPSWLLRSGISIVALVAIVVLTLAAFIKYPDKIIAKGIMTSQHPPIEHINNFAGIIEEIYVRDGAVVKENDPLLYLKNNTDKTDLDKITQFIEKYQAVKDLSNYDNSDYVNTDFLQLNYLKFNFPDGLELGELQDDYSQLQLLFSRFQQTIKQSGVAQQINTIENELINTRELRKILLAEKDYSKEELALIEGDFIRNTALNKDGLVSDLDKEKVESKWLNYQKQYSNLDQGIIQNKIREEQLTLESQKLIEERATNVQAHSYDIAQAINAIESGIKEWNRKYYVLAEIGGEVSFSYDINKNQFIKQNTVVLAIIPTDNSNKKQIRVLTTNYGIGKININDKVIIKVDGYPHKEYGLILSKVHRIADLPKIIQSANGENQQVYAVEIKLPDTLMTNYNKEIAFRPNSSVTAEIITKDKSILERLFKTFLSLTKQNIDSD